MNHPKRCRTDMNFQLNHLKDNKDSKTMEYIAID